MDRDFFRWFSNDTNALMVIYFCGISFTSGFLISRFVYIWHTDWGVTYSYLGAFAIPDIRTDFGLK